ncbi:MAG TPA: sulfurtransferase complex subunit TusC [Pseudomonadales bacterium]|nr:sulfurtransferase complex subunit TusC [Pseudomonadales bacterium]
MKKNILFILQHAPHGNSSTRESLDAALACAAFDQQVQLLFIDEGVWNLLPGQHAGAINSKDTGKMLGALAYYDIRDVFADSFSLQARQLPADALAIPVTILPADAVRALVKHADCVIQL